MHARKIIHRDIKLENVMIQINKETTTSDMKIKLVDFGLAEKLTQQDNKGRKRAGTVGYVAPEILKGDACGTASDIWSLGCLLYALLTLGLPKPDGGL